ncbi:hypothetical protein [Thiocapsa sp. N5-Cardenillas]|uniref:hypothetical protein n=1 Tax=Thiocapsa sp. N5-Cardenillas TaxID=3137397 RepID=UPI0035AF3144
MNDFTKEELVHISQINIGDTVLHDGKIITVGKENIKSCKFMGLSLFGDCYSLGYKKVQKMRIEYR